MGLVLALNMGKIGSQVAAMESLVGVNEREKEVGSGSSLAGDGEAGHGQVDVEALAVFPASRKNGATSDGEFLRRDELCGKVNSDIEESGEVCRKRTKTAWQGMKAGIRIRQERGKPGAARAGARLPSDFPRSVEPKGKICRYGCASGPGLHLASEVPKPNADRFLREFQVRRVRPADRG